MKNNAPLLTAVAIELALLWAKPLSAQVGDTVETAERVTAGLSARDSRDDKPNDVLSRGEWARVDASVDLALKWLAAQQRPDGSFPSLDAGQPAVTSLCMMAYMSHGHLPGEGRYGKALQRATDYVLSCQKRNGLVTLIGPNGSPINRNVQADVGVCAAYNHAISSLNLSELYGLSDAEDTDRIGGAINRAIAASLEMQRWPKARADDRGGWRYLYRDPARRESDLSVTGWELMFLRSARNAGIPVAEQPIDDAVAYVRQCYSEKYGSFQYVGGDLDNRSRGMAGAGILAMAHAGFHGAAEAQRTGEWILQHKFDAYNAVVEFNPKAPHERYHYSLFMCCQGMYQIGGGYWEEFFPPTVDTLLENQRAAGFWPAEIHWRDSQFGQCYTTALTVIALGAPNQLLPIFQR